MKQYDEHVDFNDSHAEQIKRFLEHVSERVNERANKKLKEDGFIFASDVEQLAEEELGLGEI